MLACYCIVTDMLEADIASSRNVGAISSHCIRSASPELQMTTEPSMINHYIPARTGTLGTYWLAAADESEGGPQDAMWLSLDAS